jgi:hypothetical protein
VLQSRSDGRDDRGEHEARGADAKEGRAPAADDSYGKHDRERLDRLDGAGEEDCSKEDDVVAHGISECRVPAADASVRKTEPFA